MTSASRRGKMLKGSRSSLFGQEKEQKNNDVEPSSVSGEEDQLVQSVLKKENEENFDELSYGIDNLKQLTKDIHSEIKESNVLIDSVTTDAVNTQNSLTTTIKKLDQVVNEKIGRHMCWVILFVMFVFFVLYYMIKSKRK
eukprot:gene4242-7579_t